jgi:hypothetical protein
MAGFIGSLPCGVLKQGGAGVGPLALIPMSGLENLSFVLLEGADHRAVGPFGNLGREFRLTGQGANLGDDLLDACRIVNGRGMGFEASGLADVFAAFGHQPDQFPIDAVDILAHLPQRRAA